MRKTPKLRLPIFLFLITLSIVLVGLFIKTFYVSSDSGKQKVTELIVSLSQFSLSIIILLLFEQFKLKNSKVVNYFMAFVLIAISLISGGIFITVYYKYINLIANKLVYLSTTNSIDFINIYSANNTISVVLNIVSIFALAIAFTTFIIIVLIPIVKKAHIHFSFFISIIYYEVKLLLLNISEGFLYKRIP